ncbi:MAG: hypothetical protein ABNH38_21840 [Tateyamaria sp.]|jgi:hypothetical protein|uniref:hypothetical protein n=1 Tax=Tateyamaria sp. TaxID=1929288 RepID=UPI0032DD3356
MLLTDPELLDLQDLAYNQRVTAADLVRSLVIGPDACQRLPSHATLRDIDRKLSSISNNINRCMKELHTAKLDGTLTEGQFLLMGKVLDQGIKEWADLRIDLREQMGLIQRKTDRPVLPTYTPPGDTGAGQD